MDNSKEKSTNSINRPSETRQTKTTLHLTLLSHSHNNPLKIPHPLKKSLSPQTHLPQQRPPLRLRALPARTQHHHLHIHQRGPKPTVRFRKHNLGDDQVRVVGRHGGDGVGEDAQAGGVGEVVEDGVEVVEAGAYGGRRRELGCLGGGWKDTFYGLGGEEVVGDHFDQGVDTTVLVLGNGLRKILQDRAAGQRGVLFEESGKVVAATTADVDDEYCAGIRARSAD